ncbi:integrator complex subunit 2-like [Teleopsis dalmanni]|uniref:integrator complex subunit 2-like n=1 Tax=Teleopsis dalmanni TaxID=139649 RepID=UPI0018CEAA26|nr:integrator complex subunit 2-like [Teleopsis dalmanni]XP_037957805.1 integrator complex subunit 2-like [Teleopsis dalmanni]
MLNVTPQVFAAMQNLDICALEKYPQNEIRPILPSLVRMTLLSPLDNTNSSMASRKQILGVLIGIEVVNSIVSYLQVNYHELELELKKELQVRQKSVYYDVPPTEFGLQTGIALGFERSDVTCKVRVVLSEIFNIQFQVAESKSFMHPELFEDSIYLEEIVDILCIALAELPSLLNILDLTDTLVHVHNGRRIICAMVANFPDYYRDVVSHLIHSCDEESIEGKLKLSLLTALSEMNPSQALFTRAICMENLKVSSFMLNLSLKYPHDLIAFLTGILLGNDQNIRSWFAVYVRSSQKRKGEALIQVRMELLQQLQNIVHLHAIHGLNDHFTSQGSVVIRLYCALRGIAGLKFNDEEISLISQLITSRPLPTQSGLRFVSLALCMLISCPSLVFSTTLEIKSVEWLQWLTKEDTFFGKQSDTTSLGEMLLLLAIHFHSNQIAAIGDLICSTLAMKIPIRPNSTNRIKQLFTQDLFTEQVVASHAVRVPVTINLNAHIPGYLPVHCIHQLIKSRSFMKHKVPIKSWIYKQICNSITPLHPVMPALIEVYVNTLITPNPSGKLNIEHIHKPFSKYEILHIFNASNPALLNTQLFSNVSNATSNIQIQCATTSQLLILYYLVLYEETRQLNILSSPTSCRKFKDYSTNFLSKLPVKYLLHVAQKNHNDYVGLFHPLLRLIVSNCPHLSMVEDWLEEYDVMHITQKCMPTRHMNRTLIVKSLKAVQSHPGLSFMVFKALLKLPTDEMAQYAELIVENIPKVFNEVVPRLTQDLYKTIWSILNTTLPISFWKTTLNMIMSSTDTTKLNIFNENIDPLRVLRCKRKVFYSPYMLVILIRILNGSVAAYRACLNNQVYGKQIVDKNGQIQSDSDREELKTALLASQESATVQILLELLTKLQKCATQCIYKLRLRESQGIICTYIHQTFITEPALAKLVHFQTYPTEIIPMMVIGVPSMHICTDYLLDLHNIPEMNKQIFMIELTSHLVLKYSIPKCLSVSKFCLNVVQTSISLLSTSAKFVYLNSVLPSLVRFVEAFPLLIDDCINILMITGKNLSSQSSLGLCSVQMLTKSNIKCFKESQKYVDLIDKAFETIVTKIVNRSQLY